MIIYIKKKRNEKKLRKNPHTIIVNDDSLHEFRDTCVFVKKKFPIRFLPCNWKITSLLANYS